MEVAAWLPTACESEALLQEWAAVFSHGSSIYERWEVRAELECQEDCEDVLAMITNGVPGLLARKESSLRRIICDLPGGQKAASLFGVRSTLRRIVEDRMGWASTAVAAPEEVVADLPVNWQLERWYRCEDEIYLCAFEEKGLSLCHGLSLEYGYGYYDFDAGGDEVCVSARAVVGGGLRRKMLTPAQLQRKKARNSRRMAAFEESLKLRDPEKQVRQDFVCHVRQNSVLRERLTRDPIVRIRLLGEHAVPGEEEEETNYWDEMEETELFELQRVGSACVTVKTSRTRMNMNPVCGFEVVPEWQAAFKAFIKDRLALSFSISRVCVCAVFCIYLIGL